MNIQPTHSHSAAVRLYVIPPDEYNYEYFLPQTDRLLGPHLLFPGDTQYPSFLGESFRIGCITRG